MVVAGAGPCGSAAALTLARAGRRVLVLDKCAFPRDKTCGDLLGADAVAALRSLGLGGLASDGFALDGARVYGPAGRHAGDLRGAARDAASAARVITRETFDARMLAAARSAGAAFAVETVRNVARDASGDWTVTTSHGRHRARTVVGADGYGSRTASAAGRLPPKGSHLAVVVRGYASGVRDLGDAMHFFVNRAEDGYGWVFPLGDGRANVGLGIIASEAGAACDVRAAFARFAGAEGAARTFLADAAMTNIRSWPIPMGWQRASAGANGLFLAGDAAALASPLSGSGISNALVSGSLAARAGMRYLEGDRFANARYASILAARFAPRLLAERAMHRVAGTPERVGMLLRLASAVPFGERALARLLLQLG